MERNQGVLQLPVNAMAFHATKILYLMLEFYQSKFHDFMREIREEKEPDDNDEEDEDEELNGNNEDEETGENEIAPFPPFDG